MFPLYFDEDSLTGGVIAGLRRQNCDVLTATEASMGRQDDEDHLVFATSQGRAVVSANVPDFARLHNDYLQSQKDHCGIILIHQQRYSIGEQIRRLIALMTALSAEDMKNRLEFLSNW